MGAEETVTNEESDKVKDISDLEKKIIRQVEYYFGNYNLKKDKFLRDQLKLDDGWVPLETMVKFNRLKSLSADFSVISEALKKSPSHLMEVDEEVTKIRRRIEKPLPEDTDYGRNEIEAKSLYVKGFKKTTTLDELLDFFKEFKAEHITMRRRPVGKRDFKGSVFVIFETKEDAEKFLENKEVKYCGTELLKEKKKEYVTRKDIFYDNLRAEKAKKILLKETGTDEKQTEKDSKTKDVPEFEMVPGCLLRISCLAKDSTREDIKEVFEKYGTVVFVDYFRGNPNGVVRFETAVAANALSDLPEEDGEKKLEIGSSKATVSAIEGDDEKEYWKSIAVSRENTRLRFQNFQRGNRGRFKKNWGKRQRGRGGRDFKNEEGSTEQPPQKRLKVESNEKNDGQSEKKEKLVSNEENGAHIVKKETESPVVTAE